MRVSGVVSEVASQGSGTSLWETKATAQRGGPEFLPVAMLQSCLSSDDHVVSSV